MITFSSSRLDRIRARGFGQISATLVLPSESVKVDTVRPLWRENRVKPSIIEGPTRSRSVVRWVRDVERWADKGRQRVNDVLPDATLTQAKITILLVELVDVEATQEYDDGPRILTHKAAQACAFKTIFDLRAWWRAEHPNSPLAKLVWFAMGRVRDEERYLRRYVSRGGPDGHGDYAFCVTDDVIDTLPALSEAQYQALSSGASHRHQARRAQRESRLSEQPLAERVARIQAVGQMCRDSISDDLRALGKSIQPEETIIGDRRTRALRKIL